MEKLYPRVDIVHKRVLRLLLLFVLFIPNLSLSQNYVYSSSFETPQVTNSLGYQYNPTSTEWTFYGQSGLSKNWTVFTGANPVAPLGNQVLFLQDNGNTNGHVEKSINFSQSGYYRFAFKAAWREICCGKTKYIRILVDGVVVNGVTVDDFEVGEIEIKSGTYEEYVTPPVKLTAGSHKIQIVGDNPQNGGDYTGFVDDFRIEKLPEMPYYNSWTVPAGTTYVIGPNPYDFGNLKVDGALVAPQNQNVSINAEYILVRNSGRFQIGQERSPYLQEATITLDGTDQTSQHGHMGTKFLGAMNNGVIELHGKEKVSWTKLSANVEDGESLIKVVDAVDWEVNDEIVIAPSRGPEDEGDVDFWKEYEKRTITAIARGWKDITLNAGLTYDHTGKTKTYSDNGQTWTADIRAEVGLLTRNIKIQGHEHPDINDPSKDMYHFGAHVMIMRTDDDILYNRKPQAYFNGVELYRMGQNKKLGRYPFHWHRMNDVDGQYFKNSSVHLSYNRALTIHATNNTLVENSVFFDHIGHGIFFEEGNEEGNQILGNLVIGSKKPHLQDEAISQDPEDGETFDELQNRGPASYWITHPNNTIEGNVAAGTIGTGFWYIFPFDDLGGQGKKPQEAAFGSFNNNVAHGTSNGFDIFDALRPNHSVYKNIAYLSPADFEILNSTWYSNRVGVYTGTGANRNNTDEYQREIYIPDDHLIFKNNVFADNEKSIMLASNNQVKNSLFVANTGEGNAPKSDQTMVHMYDGAATISDSHIVGYNSNTPGATSSMMSLAGATFTYGNFRFNNVTKANNLLFDIHPNHIDNQLRRNATIYDEDGSLSGTPGSTLIIDNDFFLLGGEAAPSGSGWINFKRSSNKYVNTRLRLHKYAEAGSSIVPKVDVVRTKGNDIKTIPSASNGVTPTLPFIVNDKDLLYTYDWVYGAGQEIDDIMYTGPMVNHPVHGFPMNLRILQFKLANAVQVGDFVIVRFKDMGELPGLEVNMNYEENVFSPPSGQSPVTGFTVDVKSDFNSLKDSGTSAYFINNITKDLYIKAVSNGHFSQYFNIRWDEVTSGGVANNTVRLEGDLSLTETTEMVYPNPASNKLFIKGLSAGEEVQIVDLSGRVMQTTTYKEYLDISQLKSGVYVVRTKSGSHRFIKE